ncbi:MAG: glycosyltransferase family 2 protein [Deltaproteobacteria bacterium]|nr:glycosyltransferase family 2 protein [Deltaproteobacteria bacterium]
MGGPMPLISVVVPVFCEEKNIPRLYEELGKVAAGIKGYTWEYIFVNDGSMDGSYSELQKLAAADKNVRVLDLSRNFGKEVALSAGVHATSGRAVITLDADLQHPPKLIPEMIRKWEEGADIVATIRKKRDRQPLIRELGSRLFYWIIRRISQVDIASRTTDFRLLDKKVVDAFRSITEKSRMYRGIIDWMGFNKVYIEFDANSRENGNPTYSYRKLIGLAINGITSFSLFPLKIAGIIGILITLFSGILLLIMFPTRFVFKSSYFSPLAIMAVSNTFLIGIVLICLGLIALYIGNIHNEVVNRPLYIVKNRLNFD